MNTPINGRGAAVAEPNLLLLAVLVFVVALATLSGCANRVDVPEQVKVPLREPCVDPEKRPKPAAILSADDLMALPRYERTLASDRDLRRARAALAEREALIEGCSRLGLPR